MNRQGFNVKLYIVGLHVESIIDFIEHNVALSAVYHQTKRQKLHTFSRLFARTIRNVLVHPTAYKSRRPRRSVHDLGRPMTSVFISTRIW